MPKVSSRGAVLFACILVLSGCASGHGRGPVGPRGPEFHPPVEILLGYDANHDGTITRAEMEAGLKADFAAADTNHDGRLGEDETRNINQKRWSEGASTASPLVDWNHDGYVSFDEFAATARSLFDEMDRNGDRALSPKELHPHGPAAIPAPDQEKGGARGPDRGDDH